MALQESSGDILQGQQWDAKKNYVEAYTQQLMSIQQANALLGTPGVEITPRDDLRSLVKIFTPPIAEIEAYNEVYDGTEDFQFPATLTGITVAFNTNSGNGAGFHNAGIGVNIGPGGFSFDPSATSQSSASVMPSVQPQIKTAPFGNLPVKHYYFYIKNGDDIYAKLTALAGATVLPWPIFKPQPIYLSLHGQQVNLRQTAEVQHRDTFSSATIFNYQTSEGASAEISAGINVSDVTIPETLHGALTITNASQNEIALTAVSVSIPGIVWDLPGMLTPKVFLPETYAPTGMTKTITGSVTPTGIAATSPYTALPTSGLFLYKTTTAPFELGYSIIKATVFNFSTIA